MKVLSGDFGADKKAEIRLTWYRKRFKEIRIPRWGGLRKWRIPASDIETVELLTEKKVGSGSTAGMLAVLGGFLFGPLGALTGVGIGAAARHNTRMLGITLRNGRKLQCTVDEREYELIVSRSYS